jgi:hypothetical protein
LSYRDCLNNRQHAETTKKGGWAGLVAPKSSAELARANKEAAAFAAVLREQQLQEKQQLMPNSYHHQKMRAEVAGFVRRFREEFKARWSTNVEYKCPITGSPITSLQDCQVDHYDPPFAVLAELWLQQEGTQLADVATWTDAQKSSWADYHNTHAKLRMVSRAGNMSKAVEDRKATVAIRQRRNAQQGGSGGIVSQLQPGAHRLVALFSPLLDTAASRMQSTARGPCGRYNSTCKCDIWAVIVSFAVGIMVIQPVVASSLRSPPLFVLGCQTATSSCCHKL